MYSNANDTLEIQKLRFLSSGTDTRRPPEDRVAERYFEAISEGNAMARTYLPHSDLVYCRAALEARFEGRTFTFKEIKELIYEVYGVKYT